MYKVMLVLLQLQSDVMIALSVLLTSSRLRLPSTLPCTLASV